MVLTRHRTIRPSCVLLDADVIIAAHELGIFGWLVQSYRVLIPSVVLHEANHYHSKSGRKVEINLSALVSVGVVEELAATAVELAQVYSYFDASFVDTIHAGETEGLALLHADKASGAVYCCGDRRAIQALAMLGLGDRGVSLEALLAGKKPTGKLAKQFTEDFFRANIRIGQNNRIIGTGLNKGILD